MNLDNKWLIVSCIGIMLVVSVVLYPSLPAELPSRWGFDGQVQSTMPKIYAVLFQPALATAIAIGMIVLPKIDPRRESYEKFAPSYYRIRSALIVFITGMHILMLTQYDNADAVVKLIVFGVALVLAVIGNEMGRIRPTWLVGIRTPWTLADERVWRKVHRVGGRYFVGVGALNMLLILILPMPLAGIIFVVSAVGVSIGLTIYSYLLYNQLNTA